MQVCVNSHRNAVQLVGMSRTVRTEERVLVSEIGNENGTEAMRESETGTEIGREIGIGIGIGITAVRAAGLTATEIGTETETEIVIRTVNAGIVMTARGVDRKKNKNKKMFVLVCCSCIIV